MLLSTGSRAWGTPGDIPGSVSIDSRHAIVPRIVWGSDLPPTGQLQQEAPGDVRFLLVHHSASPNDYSPEQSIRYLRSFYNYHTSAEKGWPDIAYNFLVDRYGQIFEGREGSIGSPIKGDATGGSQGYALLTCFIGDHREVAPTPDAQSAMVALLAWLAGTYGIDPGPGATAEFVSRGSNLHPEGMEVVTSTITGHRTMSRTTCPGDEAFELVEHSFPVEVAAALSMHGPEVPSPVEVPTTSNEAPAPATISTTTTPPTTSAPAAAITPETTSDIHPDTTSLAVVSTAPTVPSTVGAREDTEPAAVPTTTEVIDQETRAVAPPPTAPATDSAGGTSRQLMGPILAGIGGAMLAAAYGLRRWLGVATDNTSK